MKRTLIPIFNDNLILSKIILTQQLYVLLQSLVCAVQHPPLKVRKVKPLRVVDLLALQPLQVKREVLVQMIPVKYPIHHMTTKHPYFHSVFEGIVNDFALA